MYYLFTLEEFNDLRVSGVFLIKDELMWAFYQDNLCSVIWNFDLDFGIGTIAHEFFHHLEHHFSFSSNRKIIKYIKKNYPLLLKFFETNPLYKGNYEKGIVIDTMDWIMNGMLKTRETEINEAFADLFAGLVAGKRLFGALRYRDIKMFKDKKLLNSGKSLIPEEYFPEEFILTFPGDNVIQKGFLDMLKDLYDIRSKDSEKELIDVVEEYVFNKINKQEVDLKLLLIAEFFEKLGYSQKANKIYNKIAKGIDLEACFQDEEKLHNLIEAAISNAINPVMFGRLLTSTGDKKL